MARVNRKLATILATDCVDFSKFMETQEELTLVNLSACRDIIDPIVEEHGGRIFHTAGDSVIADFGSPVECVHAAMKFQEALASRNETIEEGPKLEWRVGIHVDDVIIEGDNIYGSGVNIAARLEAQCEPGKVLLSRIVQEQVQKRVNFAVSPAGTRALKNISEEFEVFYITKGMEESVADGEAQPGGIRSSGKRVRISLELSEVESGKAVWRDRYDRVIEDIFDLQDEIVRTITISLLGEIEISSLQRAKRKATENISSYEYLLRGKEMHHRFDKEANAQALEFFDKAIQADPSNAQAHAWKACTLGQGVYRGFLEGDANEIINEGIENISRALEVNENDFECHRMLSAVYLSRHEYQLAEEHGRRAYDMNPNDPRVLAGYGEVLARVGKANEAIELLEKALSLDPVPQGQINSDNRYTDLTLAYFYAGEFEKCIETGKKVEHINFQSWLLVNFSKKKLDSFDGEDMYLKQGLEEFKEDSWDPKVDRLHLPDEKTQSELLSFLNNL